MPKDFAGRGRADSKKSKPRARRPRKQIPQRVLFHGPSFSFGAIVGAAIIILAAYGPEFLEHSEITAVASKPVLAEKPKLQFDFPDLLKETEVQPDPEPYAVPEPVAGEQSKQSYLQAASFRQHADAEKLRAELLLDNLPARTVARKVNNQQWYRVVLGPFMDARDADRARNRLSERGLFATPVNDPN